MPINVDFELWEDGTVMQWFILTTPTDSNPCGFVALYEFIFN